MIHIGQVNSQSHMDSEWDYTPGVFTHNMHGYLDGDSRSPAPGPQSRICFVKFFLSQAGNLDTIHLWDIQPTEGLLTPAAEEIALLDF